MEEVIPLHPLTKNTHSTIDTEEIDGYMWYKAPWRPPGQPGQAGRDGRDGQIPQLPRGMINVLGIAPAPFETTGLENSFKNLGRTMANVLTLQQQTNEALKDQIRRANET